MKEFSTHSYSKMQVSRVNERAENSREEFFRECEEAYQQQVERAASMCRDEKRMILLAGPSASGKTTTAHKIAKAIIEQGRKAEVVSLDDFYRNRSEIPLCEDGKPDLESVLALDLEILEKCFQELLETGQAKIPRYDFTNSRRAEEWREVRCTQDEVLIIEGIHALNPAVQKALDLRKVVKVYVSARTKFLDGEENALIPATRPHRSLFPYGKTSAPGNGNILTRTGMTRIIKLILLWIMNRGYTGAFCSLF